MSLPHYHIAHYWHHTISHNLAIWGSHCLISEVSALMPCDAMSSNEWLLTFRRKRDSSKRREPSSHRHGVTCRKNWILIITLQNHFASVRLKVCRFSAIRAFFSADRLINQEVKRLLRHTDRPFTSLCLPAACTWRRLVSINHCLFLRFTFPLQTNKQTYIQTTWRFPTYKKHCLCYQNTQQCSFSPLLNKPQFIFNYTIAVHKRSSSSARENKIWRSNRIAGPVVLKVMTYALLRPAQSCCKIIAHKMHFWRLHVKLQWHI
jgi:hypothetical protein